jgi:hypothetical protein
MLTKEQERTLTLKRRYFEFGTYSYLYNAYGVQIACVIEPPFLDNEKGKSCVVEGTYRFVPHKSPTFGDVYVLINENLGVGINGELRTYCYMHSANIPSQLQGCMAPGSKFSELTINGVKQWGVIDSATTFKGIMNDLNGEEYTMIIEKD